MASSPITSWQIEGEPMKILRDFIFLGSKIIADVECSHGIKKHLLLGIKVMTNLDNTLKSRDITLLTKSISSKLCFFQQLCIYESGTIQKAENCRIDFYLQCWSKVVRVLQTARKSNQEILKETSPEYSLEGLILKLKFQYFGHLM